MTSANAEPEQPVEAAVPAGEPALPEPVLPGPVLPGSLLPERSSEDTDAAWGDYPERSDDRLYRDRPPHWADY
jgi:hypothetical protein